MLFAVLLIASSSVRADEPKPAAAAANKGFWRVLVKPNAKWILRDKIGDKGKNADTITVETYDVRKVGAADVARLRWTLKSGKDSREVGSSDEGRYTQVAVTDAGLYILSADMDDAQIAEALKKKPSRSDPPKPYKGSKQNEGRYLETSTGVKGALVCMGYAPITDHECEDTCFGEVCISPTAGVVKLGGNWAPGVGIFAQDGYGD
jgi:hypothetical protein